MLLSTSEEKEVCKIAREYFDEMCFVYMKETSIPTGYGLNINPSNGIISCEHHFHCSEDYCLYFNDSGLYQKVFHGKNVWIC